MSKRYILLVFIFFIGLCGFLFTSFYQEAKRESINNLNIQQLLYAKQAARSIEDFFAGWTTILTTLSRTDHIRYMDSAGRENIESLYKDNSELLRIITRVDASGRIIYTIPYDRNAIGRDISSQKHISEIMKTHKPVISDVFFAVQGYSIVALHVPVFNDKTYLGSIAIGINFQSLAKRYLESIKIGETGYAWIVSRDGTELFCPVPGHVGNSVFKNCKDFPSILTMAEDMLKGHEGTTVYYFDKIREDTMEVVKKHAVYMPIPIGNTYWSMVVASSEDEVISSLKDFRNRLFVIIGILLLGGVLFSYYGLKALFIIREEEKRKQAEEALRESEATIRALINNAPADSILLLDTKGVILEINQIGAERLGKKREELIGINAYKALPEDVASERLAIMMQMFDTGKLVRYEDKRGEIWFDTVAFPILNKDNAIAKIAVIARDITKRKQMEELFSRMAKEWQHTFDAINASIWILDKNQRIIRANKTAEQQFHRTFYEMIGENCWKIVHGTDRPIPECPVSRARESLHREKMDLQIGNNWFEITVDPILDEAGEFAGAVHILTDITERKWAEEWFEKLNLCFLNFKTDPIANINLLVALCGEMFGAASALYNRLEGDMLCSVGQWNTPPEYNSADQAKGRICNDIIKGDGDNYVIIRNLQHSSYAESDTNVKPSQIQTYIGKAVQFKDVNIGSLCVVFLQDFIPSENQKRLMGIIASAIGIEEERNIAEKALQESRNLLDATQKLAKIGGWEWDVSGQRMTWTEQTYRIHGFNPGDIEDGSPEHIERSLACYDPDDRRIIEEAFRCCAEEGQPYILEFPFNTADGRRIWIQTIANPLMEDGRIVKVTGNIMDVTERKQAEDELRESEELKRTILENIPDFILLHKKGIVQYVNPAVYNTLGYKPEDVINKSIYQFINPKYHETVTSAVIKRINGENIEPYEIEIYTKAGEKRTVIISGNVIKLGGDVISLNVITDITERKQAEDTLRANRTQLMEIIDFLPDATLVIDKERRVIVWNKAIEKMTGIPASEILGKGGFAYSVPFYGEARKTLMDLIFEDSKENEARYSFITREGDTIMAEVFCNALNNNKGAWVFATASPLHDQAGNVLGAIESIRDISVRKQAEKTLRESEEKYRQLSEDMPVYICTFLPDGTLTYVNRAIADLAGLTSEALTGRCFFNMLAQKDRAVVQGALASLRPEQSVEIHEQAFAAPEGSLCIIQWTNRAFFDESGHTVFFQAVGVDITERKRIENALRENEEKYRTLFENAVLGVFRTTPEGIYLNINRALARIYGYDSPEEMISSVTDIKHQLYANPEDREKVAHQLRTFGEIKNFEAEKRHRDGHSIWTSMNARALTNDKGDIICWEGTMEDITARKMTEAALLNEQLKLKSYIENSPFGIMLISENGTISYINRKFKEIFGYEPEDIPDGRTWLRKAYPDAAYRHEVVSAWIGDMEKAGVGEQRPRVYDVKCKDGSTRTINFLPVMLATGDNIMACEDITERMRTEEEKRKLEERFARAEKMEALGTLAGGVAHDLNNVLGIVVGYAELLLDEVEKTSDIREHVESIYESGRKAAAMIEDMLTMARRGVQSRQIVNLNRIISEGKISPEFMRLSPQLSSVQIKEDLDPDLLNIAGSPVHLSKTLLNLILNAFEAMPKGGILTISTYNQYLEKPVKGYDEVRAGDYVVLSVSDTGTGIKSADLKRIFEPFYTKKIMGRSGTGLGLSVVWSTVKDQNGYIDVQSEEGKGSVFTLYFPVSREELTAEDISISISEYMGKGESILVVDDVKGQRDLAAEMLRKLNYKVIAVSSGEEAVEYLKDNEVDIMLLDMIMEPGMDGLDTYKSVLEIRPKQKAIIVSGFSETDRVEKAQKLGAGAYVKKPYVLEKLGLAVKNELERRQ